MSFEDIEKAINAWKLLAVETNKNQTKYFWQKVLVVEINNYAYKVPYRKTEKGIHLITVFPSRKAYKLYINNNANGSN